MFLNVFFCFFFNSGDIYALIEAWNNQCQLLIIFKMRLLTNGIFRICWKIFNLTEYSCLRWDWVTRAENLEWDILNPDYLIWVSNWHTFDFLLNPFFHGYKIKTRFFKLASSSHVSVFNLKIRLVTILRKREDQALILVSTILQFSAQNI